jgi:chemotaxis methyl-accepting protein methylase
MHDEHFRQLLDRFNYSWSGYRKVRKGVKKRISRHMQELNCPNISVYLQLLSGSDAVRQESERRMTVSISRFFRDGKLWQALEEEILPFIMETEKKILRVWSAGCASGEEVYSFKIVWDGFTGKCVRAPDLGITATDIHPDYIERARAAIYAKSSLKEVPPDIREYYFNIRKRGRQFGVKPFLKKDIDWKVQDIFTDPPGPAFDIIFLRNNLLTYFEEHKKKEGLDKITRALAPDGWLIVGSHEKMPPGTENFKRHNSIPWAYRQEV